MSDAPNDDDFDVPLEEPVAPRYVAFLGGVVFAVLGLLMLGVGVGLGNGLLFEWSISLAVLALITLLAAVKLLLLSWLLLLNRPRPEGGFLSPISLWTLGVFWSLIPMVGFFSGAFSEGSPKRYLAMAQAFAYLAIAGTLIGVSVSRAAAAADKKPSENHDSL